MCNVFYICFLSCKNSCVPTALQFPTTKFYWVYCYAFYFISRQITMYTVCVCIYKPCFVYTIIILLSCCDCKVTCIRCNCTTSCYMSYLFVISRNYIKAYAFIFFNVCNLETTIRATSKLTV